MRSKLSGWTQYNLGCNNTKTWTIKSPAPTHTYPMHFVIKCKGNFTTKPLWEGGVGKWSFLSSLRMLLSPAEHRLASGAFWTPWSWRSSPALMIPQWFYDFGNICRCLRSSQRRSILLSFRDLRSLPPHVTVAMTLQGRRRTRPDSRTPLGTARGHVRASWAPGEPLTSSLHHKAWHGTRDVPRWAPWMQLARRRFARRWRFPVLHLVLCLEHGWFGSSALSETCSCCLHAYSLHSAAYR